MNKKRCTTCKQEKEITEFKSNAAKKDGLQTACHECAKNNSKKWYQNNKEKHYDTIVAKRLEIREKMMDYLSDKKCCRCSENDPIVLDFDHIDKTSKRLEISEMVTRQWKWETILIEIKKCQILCANCHRKKTAEEEGHYKFKLKRS